LPEVENEDRKTPARNKANGISPTASSERKRFIACPVQSRDMGIVGLTISGVLLLSLFVLVFLVPRFADDPQKTADAWLRVILPCGIVLLILTVLAKLAGY